jgi:threonine/homoserine/homoserine lactone efflux protein
MPAQQTLLAFALVSAGIMLIPGPSNFFLLAHGIGHGRRSALAAMTGVEAASAIRVLLAAAGLSAVLASSAAAFSLIRWAGVAYLAYLGIRAFRSGRPDASPGVPQRPVPLARSARKGLIVGLGNPKMVIFISPSSPSSSTPPGDHRPSRCSSSAPSSGSSAPSGTWPSRPPPARSAPG